MILPRQLIPPNIVTPFVATKKVCDVTGMSYGLSAAGYDIRLARDLTIHAKGYELGSSLELFDMPTDLLGVVHDKSTLARARITVQNTVIEPGWCGYLTLELANHGDTPHTLYAGQPIAQILFHMLFTNTDAPYDGKYQNQPDHPVGPIWERVND